MRQGKDLILATRAYAKEYRGRSWWHVIITLVVLAAGYTSVFLVNPWWAKLLSGILVALTLSRMFVIYHDFLHQSILQHSKVARGLFTVFGWYMLAPVSIWERSRTPPEPAVTRPRSPSVACWPPVALRWAREQHH